MYSGLLKKKKTPGFVASKTARDGSPSREKQAALVATETPGNLSTDSNCGSRVASVYLISIQTNKIKQLDWLYTLLKPWTAMHSCILFPLFSRDNKLISSVLDNGIIFSWSCDNWTLFSRDNELISFVFPR